MLLVEVIFLQVHVFALQTAACDAYNYVMKSSE